MGEGAFQQRILVASVGGVLALAVAIGLVYLAAGGDAEERMALALRGVSAQRVDHSFVVDGRPLALEARMFGIFAGFALALALSALRGGWRRSELPRGKIAGLLVGFLVFLVVDGVNALLHDSWRISLYQPQNELRLATGLVAGLGLAGFAAPVVNFSFWRERDQLPPYRKWQELGLDLAVAGGLGVVVATGMLGSALLSGIGLLAVVLSFTFVNAYLWVLVGLGGRAHHWSELAWPALAGAGLTILELSALAALRDLVGAR